MLHQSETAEEAFTLKHSEYSSPIHSAYLRLTSLMKAAGRMESTKDEVELKRLLTGKICLDLAGGNISLVDGDREEDGEYFPWHAALLGSLGANSYSVDLQALPAEHRLKDFFESKYHHLDFDLVTALQNIDEFIHQLQTKIPQLNEGQKLFLLNCNMFVSDSSLAGTSPAIKKRLSSLFLGSNHSQSKEQKINVLSRGVYELASKILEDNGLLLFNDQVYVKKGDKLVWVRKKSMGEERSLA